MSSAWKHRVTTKKDEEIKKMRDVIKKAGIDEPQMTKLEIKKMYNILQESKEQHEHHVKSTLQRFSSSELAQASSSGLISNLDNTVDPTASSSIANLNSKEKCPSPVFSKPGRHSVVCKKDNIQEYTETPSFKGKDFPKIMEKSISKKPVNRKKQQYQLPKTEFSNTYFDKWRSDPTKSSEFEDIVPLEHPEPIKLEPQELLQYMNEKINLEDFDSLCQEMSDKLETFCERYIISEEYGKTEYVPCKITVNGNGSLEQNLSEEDDPEASVSSSRDMLDRASKRKALCNIGAAAYENNEEASGNKFTNMKKKRTQQTDKTLESTRKQKSKKNNDSFLGNVEMIDVEEKDKKDRSVGQSLINTSDTISLDELLNAESSDEQLAYYPRRVLPESPAKNFKGPRAKEKNKIKSTKSSDGNDFNLNDEEIRKTLDELNEEIDDGYCVDVTDEKYYSPGPAKLQSKLQKARSHLENVHVAEEQKLKAEEEARKRKEEERQLFMREMRFKRQQEIENDKSRRIERDKKLSEPHNYNTSPLRRVVVKETAAEHVQEEKDGKKTR